MNKQTQITAAYWQKQEELDTDVAAQNCTAYTQLKFPIVVKGFRFAVDKRLSNRVYPKYLKVFFMLNNSGEWIEVYSNKQIEKCDNFEIIFEKCFEAKYLKVEYLKHHGPIGSHNDITPSADNVPFNSLNGFSWIYENDSELETNVYEEDYFQPYLKKIKIKNENKLPLGVKTEKRSNEVIYSNDFLKMSFSLIRPVMRFMQIFRHGKENTSKNLLYDNAIEPFGTASGPAVLNVDGKIPASFCNADIEIDCNCVKYIGVKPLHGLSWDYCFEIEKNQVLLTIEQTVEKKLRLIECEAWRCYWNLQESIASTLAYPIQKGKNGRCEFPAIINFPGYGVVLIELIEGDLKTNFLKQDSWRKKNVGMTGIECGVDFAEDGEIVLLPGKTSVQLKITQVELGLLPKDRNCINLHKSFIEVWPNVFGFRPEYFGMSNNSTSVNCHFVQHVYAEMAYYTSNANDDLSIMKLCGYSLELSLNGGMGYGSNRSYYIDSDASVLIGSGIYAKATKDLEWIQRNWIQLEKSANNLLNLMDENGIIVSKILSGNSGEYNWSTNWWDVISFGYKDAYSNALGYRALIQMASMAKAMGKNNEHKKYRLAAEKLKDSYFQCFYNEETGWLAGWKSRDVELHDYAFLFINGIAIVNGLVPNEYIVPIMEKLENKRIEVGFNHFGLGLPGNLIPIKRCDYARDVMGSAQREDGADSFGIYENGGATMSQTYYYLRALGIAGMPIAKEIEDAFLDAFLSGDVFGGLGKLCDWKSWDGRSVGYEGMLSDQFYVLLAIAKNRGLIEEFE